VGKWILKHLPQRQCRADYSLIIMNRKPIEVVFTLRIDVRPLYVGPLFIDQAMKRIHSNDKGFKTKNGQYHNEAGSSTFLGRVVEYLQIPFKPLDSFLWHVNLEWLNPYEDIFRKLLEREYGHESGVRT